MDTLGIPLLKKQKVKASWCLTNFTKPLPGANLSLILLLSLTRLKTSFKEKRIRHKCIMIIVYATKLDDL